MGRQPKTYTKNEILSAMAKTKSVKAASRYLGCSYQHLKPIMKMYIDEATGKSLFELHKNQQGKGVPKHIRKKKSEPALVDILEGRIDSSLFNPDKLKRRLITEGFLPEKCAICGFEERRLLDHKIPLILNFKDRNKKNFSITNIQLLCYNHFFLMVGNVFNNKDLDQLETQVEKYKTTEAVNLELDDYHLERLRELGLHDAPPKSKDDDLVSYI
jgi:hypothetical protein